MLTQASDYQMLDVSAVVDRITGNIIPAQDVAGQGNMLLRKEDFWFLHEGYLQRTNWNKPIPTAKTTPYNRVYLTDEGRGFVFSEGATFVQLNCIPRDAVLKNDFLESVSSAEIGDYYTGGTFDFKELEVVASYTPLKPDFLRRRYHNMMQVQRMHMDISLSDLIESLVVTTTDVESGNVSTYTTTNLTRPTIYSVSGSGNRRVSYNYKSSPITAAPWATEAFLFARVGVSVGGTGEQFAYIRLSCQIDNGEISIPSLAEVTSRAAALVGCPFSAAPFVSDTSVSMRLYIAKLFVTNNFTAEVDSLGWEYQ